MFEFCTPILLLLMISLLAEPQSTAFDQIGICYVPLSPSGPSSNTRRAAEISSVLGLVASLRKDKNFTVAEGAT